MVNIKLDELSVDCFGAITPYTNIEVVCNDESDDLIYPNGFKGWTEAVYFLNNTKLFPSGIVQLTAI